MSGLTTADRVVALLEWGDVAEADAAIATVELDAPDGWQAQLWRGARALMEGRFSTCELLAADAARRGEEAREPRAAALTALLLVALRREQRRPAEAEILLRGVLDEQPMAPVAVAAALAAVLGEMGRDAQAGQELRLLLPGDPVAASGQFGVLFQLAELAAALDAGEEAGVLYRRLAPHAGDFAVEDGGAVFYGSMSLALGRLAHAGGRPDDAAAHLEEAVEAHIRVGAPLLLAHTQRHLAALLRARGGPGDWDRAVDLLDSAAGIYRQLGVDQLAAETQVVLARSEDGAGRSPRRLGAGRHRFRRQEDGWLIGPPDETVRIPDTPGVLDIARLLYAVGREVHVFDLLEGTPFGGPTGGRAWPTAGFRTWRPTTPLLDATTRADYERRMDELGGELVEAEREGDRVRAALARAERDALTSALAEQEVGDPMERARKVVTTRIRLSVDRIERVLPELGHHLRRSIRTGTFCAYEPTFPVDWDVSAAAPAP